MADLPLLTWINWSGLPTISDREKKAAGACSDALHPCNVKQAASLPADSRITKRSSESTAVRPTTLQQLRYFQQRL